MNNSESNGASERSGEGPYLFRVVWGNPFKGMTAEMVRAWDTDEALVTASEKRPDLARARVAFLVEEK
jgi:hypothetical protein